MARSDMPENIVPLFAPSAPMHTDVATRYLMRRKGRASVLTLSQDDESIIFTRSASWTKPEAEALARKYGYDQYAWLNADLSHGAGVMTGLGYYEPVVRRLLASVG